MMNKQKQTGFTLVEIAIVLVVIGLLLGGVLSGQQLISSARVRNMADQNTQIQAAYFGFIDRFRQIPGDMPPALACEAIGTAVDTNCGTSPTTGGDQNGRVDQWGEASALWVHLSQSQFLAGSFGGTAITTVAAYEGGVSSGQVPGNAFQQPVLLGQTNDYDDTATTTTVRLAYVFGAGAAPSLLRELDVKLDDGAPGTGVVRATVETTKAGETGDDFGSASAAGNPTMLWSGTPVCINSANSATATWNVDSNNNRCNAVFLY